MELIFSKGVLKPDSSFADSFIELMGDADYLKLATGYVSEDSLFFLLENLKNKPGLSCELVIGMHAFEGFTRSQFQTAFKLGEFLSNNKRGCVTVCCAYPFHGKIYNFYKESNPLASIIGSANITQLIPTRQRNVSLKIDDGSLLKTFEQQYYELQKLCKSICAWKPGAFRQSNSLLEDCEGVTQLTQTQYRDILDTKTNVSFKLPLKAEGKSNLNICFGKGRENTNKGIIKPRSWFEFEIIVPQKITSLKGYPRDKKFSVITDDGWSFECKTQGDYSKNLRSTGGLAILGMWVKGKLLDAGAVNAGELITPEMIHNYGADYIELTATKDPNIWLLDFRGR